MTDYTPVHFFDDPIEVQFDSPPVREKAPHCPNGFTWRGQTYRVAASLSEWADFARRGRAAKNLRPEHAVVAAGRGSLNVGRYYFRVRAVLSSSSSSSTAGQQEQIFDLYYDRAMKNVDDRQGQWVLYRELE